jgi:outer membrane protein TolC
MRPLFPRSRATRALPWARILASPAAALVLALAVRPAPAQPWTLARVLEAARRHDPGVEAARAAGEAGRAEGAGSVSALSPRVAVHSGLSRTDDPAMLFSEKLEQGRFQAADFALDRLNHPSPATALSWGASVDVPLWNGGAEWTATAHAGHLRGAATAGERAAVADRLLHAVGAYVGAVSARRAVEADSLALAAAAEDARAAAARLRAGQVSELDSLRALARWAEARTSLLERRKDAAVALSRLAQIVGEPVDGADLAEPALEALAEPRAASAAARPEARQAEERAAALAIESRRAGYRLLPSINSRAAVDYYYDPSGGATEHRWAVGVFVELPIWDGARRLQDARAARARARVARAEAQGLARELATQADEARLERDIADERRDAAATRRTAAEAALDLAQRRYSAGLLPWSELVAAESDAAQARQQEIAAVAGIVLAHYRYLHSVGELQ